MENAVKYLTIDDSQAGQRLLAFLGRNLRGQTGAPLPGALLHRLVRSGQITRDMAIHYAHEQDYVKKNA